ncbi:MAG: Spo0B domain-containing protein [Clostridia bacterium]|nr:Spo0B domain-containing protein [Clostridia bacterium]
MKKPSLNINVRKTAMFSVIINAIQALLMSLLLLYLFLSHQEGMGTTPGRILAAAAALVVGSGAIADIRDALAARKLMDKADAMTQTMEDMENFNNTLRAQRHDFLNHLQVVYSLMEMQEYEEANAYIEKVYGEIARVSRVMKTRNAAVNALLQVKLAACEKSGIQMRLDIRSTWESLPMQGWEMCKVLSNLIDNAMDAVEDVADKKLCVSLLEDLHSYRFSVSNNGPMIPAKSREAIFQAGVTGKAKGHGMGLYIVRKTLQEHGGDICVESTAEETVFSGFVPREILKEKTA